MARLGAVEMLIKADIVSCFDRLDHDILHRALSRHLGNRNEPFIVLIQSLLKCSIIDVGGSVKATERDWRASAKKVTSKKPTIGTPQGSPLSLVLTNIYLHDLFTRMQSFVAQESQMNYLRYGDDFLVSVKVGEGTTGILAHFTDYFECALADLKLERTQSELLRGDRRPMLSLKANNKGKKSHPTRFEQ
ncbi:hypothetical protein AB3S75_033362 [Citrus x aurantiifolia]